jgi:hypothetical protein
MVRLDAQQKFEMHEQEVGISELRWLIETGGEKIFMPMWGCGS